ncbi:MAG: FAD-dependent oxidoreductase [Acetivibrio sp.]
MRKLFTEIKIGSMTVKNRTFMAPMSLGYESQDGTVNETMKNYWEARAKGGVGCIILDALSVDPKVPYLGNTLSFRGEESIKSYQAFTEGIHAFGTKIIPQITHPGPESISSFFGVTPVASSAYINSMGQKTRALELEEIPGIIEQYAAASYGAKMAGFDGIELHCAHAYMLLGSFLSPMRNKRTDGYGGTLLNRARLLFEVIDGIKERCGSAFPIILRMSGSERDEQGNTLEDMKFLVPILEKHGIDAFEISGGTQYERCNKIIPCHGEVRGLNVPEAEEIKKIASKPVLVVGKINEPSYAEYLVDSEKVDGVVIGRALLSDPEFVMKMENKRESEIAPCAGCGIGCVGEQTKRRPASCVINPSLGREKEMQFTQAEEIKNVIVVGGGIGGLAAARAWALGGHKVTLLEKETRVGGQINIACIPPHKQEISRWIVYLQEELKRLQVEVVCGVEATPSILDERKPDVVIAATGSRSFVPPIEGVDTNTAITAQKLLKNEEMILGGNVLVVGGGMVGCEICELLLHRKRGPMEITMIEMLDEIGGGMVPNVQVPMMKRLHRPEIKMMPSTKLLSVGEEGVLVESRGQKLQLQGFTHVVFACGSKSDTSLYEQIKERYPKVVFIGDAKDPRQALEAVREGMESAR